MSVAAVALAAYVLPAHAAGPYDGSWYVDAPAAGQDQPTQESSGCEALRIAFTVKDNRVAAACNTTFMEKGSSRATPAPVPPRLSGRFGPTAL